MKEKLELQIKWWEDTLLINQERIKQQEAWLYFLKVTYVESTTKCIQELKNKLDNIKDK